MTAASGLSALPGAEAVRYTLLWVLFAVAQFPVTVGVAVLLLLGSRHVVAYGWVAVPLVAEAVPGALYWRLRRLGRALSAESAGPLLG
jgi:Flp pilus assembly pilin Flp